MVDSLGDGVLLVVVDNRRIAGLAVNFQVQKGVTLTGSEDLANIDSADADVQSLGTLTIIDGRNLTSLTQTLVFAVCT